MENNMIYNEESHITTVEEVANFFHHLVFDLKLNFHPDDDFAEYVNSKTKEPLFTPEEIALYNRLMAESFKVCEDSEDKDIYDLGWDQLEEAINKGVL